MSGGKSDILPIGCLHACLENKFTKVENQHGSNSMSTCCQRFNTWLTKCSIRLVKVTIQTVLVCLQGLIRSDSTNTLLKPMHLCKVMLTKS